MASKVILLLVILAGTTCLSHSNSLPPEDAAFINASDPCAGKTCPSLSLRPCTVLAPGGVTRGCNKTTGECLYGPIINAPDGMSCKQGRICWKGQCVLNRCANRTCPTAAATLCTRLRASKAASNTPTCNPLTGRCLAKSAMIVKKTDGTSCGSGSVCWKGECVPDKCGGKACPMISITPCHTIAPGGTPGHCNPTTGQCEVGPVVPVPDGQECGWGTCKGGECIP